MSTDSNRVEKLGLLFLAGLALVGLIWIARLALKAGSLDPNAATLLGAIVAGLIAYGKDIIAAVRGYANAAQLGKVTDQLAASAPSASPPPPDDAIDAANQVAEAAANEADAIGSGS